MRKAKNLLPIVVATFAILGLLAVAGHAGKPAPLPMSVQLTGGIEIQSADHTGDPTSARVAFIDPSLWITYPDGTYSQLQEFVSNPDYARIPPDTPSLWVCRYPQEQHATLFLLCS